MIDLYLKLKLYALIIFVFISVAILVIYIIKINIEQSKRSKTYYIVYETDYGKSEVFVFARNKREAIKLFRRDYPNKIVKIIKHGR